MARLGVRIGGISGGPYLMAAAGLLADRAFTLHWEYAGATVETFPDARLTRARYVTDGDRLTCGGGVAPLEMAHALIAERMGEAFARRVSDWFLHTAIGAADDPQRASAVERYGIHIRPCWRSSKRWRRRSRRRSAGRPWRDWSRSARVTSTGCSSRSSG